MAKGDPLTFDLDDGDVRLFCDEAEEQIALLDTALVQLEGEPDPELVQRIFRAAHTLKGSSASIGHARMAALTHAMETVLDAVRQGRLTPSAEVVDALLAGVDVLRVLGTEVVTRTNSGAETGSLEGRLLALVAPAPGGARAAGGAGAESSEAFPEDGRAVGLEARSQGKDVTGVTIAVDPGCGLPGIRCYQVLQALDAAGEVLWLDPPREVVDAGNGEFQVSAVIAGAAVEGLRAALAEVSDLAGIAVDGFEADAGPLAADAARAGDTADRPKLEVIPGTGSSAGQPRKTSASVRIDVERLDGLMNLVGELVIDRTRLQQVRDSLRAVLKDANLAELMANLEETTAHLARVTDELQEEIMRSRMLPVRSVFARLPRLVRDVASKCGKRVELVTAGEETELDRSVIEELSDPLVHILRNAVDHGIETPEGRRAAGKPETGTVRVTAWNQESSIYLSIRDDGRGLDTDALRQKAVERGLVPREVAEAASEEAVQQYIFFAGLSTAGRISDVSGRGVGMDIVRTNIERLNGRVSVRSTQGRGSEFLIQLPLTLATTKALMVVANRTVYAIPLVSVTEALAEEAADISHIAGRPALRLRDKLLPLLDLAASLGDGAATDAAQPRFIVAARHAHQESAFLVDRLLGEQDVVVKSLGGLIGNRSGLTGATILGDGTLGLIVDTASLVTGAPVAAATA